MKQLARTSKRRAGELVKYAKLKAKFLEDHPFCFVCNNTIPPRYRTLHHFYGRTDELLCWVPGFRTACMRDHKWIEEHRNDAVRLGYRASNAIFGRPSKVIPHDTTRPV